jgi:hypothetical protein
MAQGFDAIARMKRMYVFPVAEKEGTAELGP